MTALRRFASIAAVCVVASGSPAAGGEPPFRGGESAAAELLAALDAGLSPWGPRPDLAVRRRDAIAAAAASGDPACVPPLIEFARRCRRTIAVFPGLPAGTAPANGEIWAYSMMSHEAQGDWEATLVALAAFDDARTEPAFRDAVVWAAPRGETDLLVVAVEGLNRHPSPENLPTLEAALADLPAVRPDIRFRWHRPDETRSILAAAIGRHRRTPPVEAARPEGTNR